ncbi:UNVERIFIED_CONTAM: hypothetical protein GTU68_000285, partial [Idotea baltica]|nr:hypothetical protein [Idotea baltica]
QHHRGLSHRLDQGATPSPSSVTELALSPIGSLLAELKPARIAMTRHIKPAAGKCGATSAPTSQFTQKPARDPHGSARGTPKLCGSRPVKPCLRISFELFVPNEATAPFER